MSGLNIILHQVKDPTTSAAEDWVIANASWVNPADDRLWIVTNNEDDSRLGNVLAVRNLEKLMQHGSGMECVDLGLQLTPDLIRCGANNDFLVASCRSVAREDWRYAVARA